MPHLFSLFSPNSVAATDKAEAEKILVVKQAEADAEAKFLAGARTSSTFSLGRSLGLCLQSGLGSACVRRRLHLRRVRRSLTRPPLCARHAPPGTGIARQRQAIVNGLRQSVITFSEEVQGVNSKDVLDLLLVTQYFDMLKARGAHARAPLQLLLCSRACMCGASSRAVVACWPAGSRPFGDCRRLAHHQRATRFSSRTGRGLWATRRRKSGRVCCRDRLPCRSRGTGCCRWSRWWGSSVSPSVAAGASRAAGAAAPAHRAGGNG